MENRIAVKSDWDTTNMPFKKARFKLKRHFTNEEIQNLRCGCIPEEMEDRWFMYFEEDTMYIHRSWTGYCIYIVEFDFQTDVHRVVVNRDKEQYTCTSKKEDSELLNRLLDWWVNCRNGRLL